MTRRYDHVADCPKCGSSETWADAPEYGAVSFGCDDCSWHSSHR